MGLVWTLFFCAAIQNRFQILTLPTYWQDCDVLREDIDLVIIIKPGFVVPLAMLVICKYCGNSHFNLPKN